MGAPSFKDCVAADIHGVFLNNQEFASTHTIDGKEMDAVVDDDALLERDAARGGVHTDGTYRTRRLLYVDKSRLRRAAHVGQDPEPGRPGVSRGTGRRGGRRPDH